MEQFLDMGKDANPADNIELNTMHDFMLKIPFDQWKKDIIPANTYIAVLVTGISCKTNESKNTVAFLQFDKELHFDEICLYLLSIANFTKFYGWLPVGN